MLPTPSPHFSELVGWGDSPMATPMVAAKSGHVDVLRTVPFLTAYQEETMFQPSASRNHFTQMRFYLMIVLLTW